MMTKNTFHATIVPIIAPTCRNIARPLYMRQAPRQQRTRSSRQARPFRGRAGTLAQLVVEDPAADEQRHRIPIACHLVMSATLRSIM
jgi:hypothetical protein